MKIIALVCGLVLLGVAGEPLRAAEKIRGLVIYDATPAAKGTAVPFSSITWKSSAIGSLQTPEGETFDFANAKIIRLIFLDEPYWKSISDDEALSVYRSDVTPLEVVLPMNRPNMTSEADRAAVSEGQKKVATLIRDYPAANEVLLAVQANLDRQMQWYEEGQRKVNAKWLTKEQYAQVSASTGNSLTTSDGRTYQDFTVTQVDPVALHISYAGGAASIPFEKLSKEEQDRYHYDAAKAAAFKASQQQRLAQSAPKIPQVTMPSDQSTIDQFLAKCSKEAAEKIRQELSTLDAQKVVLMVTQSKVLPTGVLAMVYDPVKSDNEVLREGKPVFIVGHFDSQLDSGPFTIGVIPAGNCSPAEYTDPQMPRFVTGKMAYLHVTGKDVLQP